MMFALKALLASDRHNATSDPGPGRLRAWSGQGHFPERERPRGSTKRRSDVMLAIQEQLESPLVAVLGAGAAISLAVGAVADVAIIAAVGMIATGVAGRFAGSRLSIRSIKSSSSGGALGKNCLSRRGRRSRTVWRGF